MVVESVAPLAPLGAADEQPRPAADLGPRLIPLPEQPEHSSEMLPPSGLASGVEDLPLPAAPVVPAAGDWVPLRSSWQPSPHTWGPLADNWQQVRAEALAQVPRSEPDWTPATPPPSQIVIPPPPAHSEPAPAPLAQFPGTNTSGSPPRADTPDSQEERPAGLLLPLVLFNRAFDLFLLPLGPLGGWLRGRSGRNFLGTLGLACLLAALALAVADGIGWTW
jgi:hypothetical protein